MRRGTGRNGKQGSHSPHQDQLEDQARKAFAALLSADFQTVIYKENRDDWRRAEIVVTTVQSLLFNNKHQRLFSPTDFDLGIEKKIQTTPARGVGGREPGTSLESLSGQTVCK